MPGSLKPKFCCDGGLEIGTGPPIGLWTWEGVTTLIRRLLGFVELWKLFESGCHVRRRHASSALDDVESRREKIEAVGEAMTLGEGEKAPGLDELTDPGPNKGLPRLEPCGDWKGIPPLDGTLSRRPGVLLPVVYML